MYLSRRRRTEKSSGERTRLASPNRGESDSSKLKVLRFVNADDLKPKHKKTKMMIEKMRLYDNLDIFFYILPGIKKRLIIFCLLSTHHLLT